MIPSRGSLIALLDVHITVMFSDSTVVNWNWVWGGINGTMFCMFLNNNIVTLVLTAVVDQSSLSLLDPIIISVPAPQ